MLVRKYGLEPVELHDALLRATRRQKSICGSLSIAMRGKADHIFTFMFMLEDRAVAQTTLTDDSLEKLLEVPLEFTELLHDLNRPFTATDCAELEKRIGGRLDMRIPRLESAFALPRRTKLRVALS